MTPIEKAVLGALILLEGRGTPKEIETLLAGEGISAEPTAEEVEDFFVRRRIRAVNAGHFCGE